MNWDYEQCDEYPDCIDCFKEECSESCERYNECDYQGKMPHCFYINGEYEGVNVKYCEDLYRNTDYSMSQEIKKALLDGTEHVELFYFKSLQNMLSFFMVHFEELPSRLF